MKLGTRSRSRRPIASLDCPLHCLVTQSIKLDREWASAGDTRRVRACIRAVGSGTLCQSCAPESVTTPALPTILNSSLREAPRGAGGRTSSGGVRDRIGRGVHGVDEHAVRGVLGAGGELLPPSRQFESRKNAGELVRLHLAPSTAREGGITWTSHCDLRQHCQVTTS
jgi:hypothetical protein